MKPKLDHFSVRSPSVTSEDAPPASVIHDVLENEGTVISHGDIPARRRHVSGALSTISRREISFSSYTPQLYDTLAIWKHDARPEAAAGLPVELETHTKKALDRYVRLVGQPMDFKRAVTSEEFLAMVTNERLRYMPNQGSRLDKMLKKAEGFATKFDKIIMTMKLIDMSTSESSALVLSSCKRLLSFAQKYTIAIERFFSVLEEATAIILRMATKLDDDSCSEKMSSIFQSALSMIVDIVVDVTASICSHRQVGSDKTVIAQFEARFEVILTRLVQLKAEFQLQTLNRWLEIRGSTESLLLILRGFDEFGLDTCPPAYLDILVRICLSLQPHADDAQSLRWFRLLWGSLEKHRHECDISTEQLFEVYQEYIVVLGAHEEFGERLRLAESFRALILSDFGTTHHLYVRASIELAKILELESLRYNEAVAIYEELCRCDLHLYEDREAITALIEIAKYRLTLLFESHPELGHRAETLLIEAFASLKLQFPCSHEKVLVALTRIIEYHRKQKRRENITAAIKIIEEYTVSLLVEERNEVVLFDISRSIAKMYRELSSVEHGIKLIQMIKEEVTLGGILCSEGHMGFKHDQLIQLDRRCFVFIHALEQLLCGYEREKMLDEIIREVYTETCLYESWSVSVRQRRRPIWVRLAAGARLLSFLELKGRENEARGLRSEMWEMFKDFCPASLASDSIWQLFELSLANVTKKVVSLALLESLVKVSLEVFPTRNFDLSLQFLHWSRVYFKQLTKTEHSRVVELAFKISGYFSRKVQVEDDKTLAELQRISSEILVDVLKVGHLDINFGSIPLDQLNVIIRLLGERKNFSMLEQVLQYLWDTRMSRTWSGSATVATGRRLCEVKFAAGHQAAAIALIESICYNLRDVYGALHKLTVECETLRASFHNTCGNHRAARDIHVHLLEEIAGMKSDAVSGREDLMELAMDQARRLKWACHQKGGEDDKEDSFYLSLLSSAEKSLGHSSHKGSVELRDVMVNGGEKRETKWKMPEDWALPIKEKM
ncbi:uncharacterized protein UV8b_03393 [Ustilaginoidea virens]|uniref:Uncharacterized protein n=1 Tax=Ustilaginoidea virens TaxID=1159556 RepID=A0A8E5HPL7_USTVR|nr:uncharacterized protein UV8b_03393 [Ustilaginoidea virens]QUC19152.1 hypothetical protein UV8b_03393 [Ustilaginoidea virens]